MNILMFSAPQTTVLSTYEILQLVGFATGAALHLYLCWILYHTYGLRRAERSLLGLGLTIGLWHFGNFSAAIYFILNFTGATWWLKAADVLAYVALAFLPPLLAHVHFKIWGWFDDRAPQRLLRPLIILGYVPTVILPWVVTRIWSDPYELPAEKLSRLLLPFIAWQVFIFAECAVIDRVLAGKMASARERSFFKAFGISLLLIGLLFILTYLVGAREWGTPGRYLDLISKLSSLVPTAIVAYYIYRYRYLELVIRQSFVYAALAAIVMMIYVFGIRRLSIALNQSYGVRAEAVEALLILVLILLAGPLRRLTDGYLRRLFAREVGLYRDLVAHVGSAASSYGELSEFIEFAEKSLREALELREVRILPAGHAEGDAADVCRLAEERRLVEIEDRQLLDRLDAQACFVLRREGRVVGLLIVRSVAQTLTGEKREVLMVLAGHIAVAVENCQLLEEKVSLERKLAENQRLASLGQMAATVAHEVKNPLSAIKSIVQVMREDEQVKREYDRDLELITGEVDRLNRSVSQLLSFSRPAVLATSSARLGEIVDNVRSIVASEAAGRHVLIESQLQIDPVLAGEKAAALKEILLNLTLNAVQAIKTGGTVRIESRTKDEGRLCISVTDDGIGVPASMQGKIFDPFFTTKQRGTGLGLAIVARRARELGAEIKLTSPIEDGRGSRFEVVLDS